MLIHGLPEYIPANARVGPKTKVSITVRPHNVTRLYRKARAEGQDLETVRDRWFLATLLATYGRAAFPRGNLDAGRLNRLFGREIVPVSPGEFDPLSLDSELRVDVDAAIEFFRNMRV